MSERPKLLRVVGLLGLSMIAVNGVIGSGIFRLPSIVAGLMGPASPVAYVVAAVLTALVVACFAEAGSLFEKTGGPYLYAREAFGPFVAFQVGWTFFVSRLTAAAAIGNAYLDYLAYFWPGLAGGASRVTALTLTFGALVAVNYVGVRHGAWAVYVLTVAKLLPLLLFVGVGLAFVAPASHTFTDLGDSSGLRQAALLLVFAFGGFENASVPGEESKDPRRHLPFALLASIALTAVLYVLIQIVALGTLPELASDPTPIASAAGNFMGPAGAVLMTVGAVLSTVGSLSALVLVGPRILYAFAEGGQLPAALAAVHPRFHTPHVAIAAFGLVAWASAVLAGFADLAAISAMARLVFSVTTCVTIPVLRRKLPAAARRFTVPGGPAVPVAAVALALWLLSDVTRVQAVAGAATLLVGVLLYAALGRGRAAPAPS